MKKTAFIGPFPPPLGGVAVINKSFQNIVYNGEWCHYKSKRLDLLLFLYKSFKLKKQRY